MSPFMLSRRCVVNHTLNNFPCLLTFARTSTVHFRWSVGKDNNRNPRNNICVSLIFRILEIKLRYEITPDWRVRAMVSADGCSTVIYTCASSTDRQEAAAFCSFPDVPRLRVANLPKSLSSFDSFVLLWINRAYVVLRRRRSMPPDVIDGLRMASRFIRSTATVSRKSVKINYIASINYISAE